MKTSPPRNSRIERLIPGAYFHDAWAVQAGDPSLSALGQFLKAIEATPSWVNHNLLGRLYMIPVQPMHKLIAPAVLRAVAKK